MSDKGKAPLTAQQIARAERVEKKRVDKEKQQVITVTTNLAFNLTPSPGSIRADEAVVSPELNTLIRQRSFRDSGALKI